MLASHKPYNATKFYYHELLFHILVLQEEIGLASTHRAMGPQFQALVLSQSPCFLDQLDKATWSHLKLFLVEPWEQGDHSWKAEPEKADSNSFTCVHSCFRDFISHDFTPIESNTVLKISQVQLLQNRQNAIKQLFLNSINDKRWSSRHLHWWIYLTPSKVWK